jgi:hypothetical protein
MVKHLMARLRRLLDSSVVLLVLALSLGLNIYLSSRPHTQRSGPTSTIRIEKNCQRWPWRIFLAVR